MVGVGPASAYRITPRQVDYWRRSGLIDTGFGELAQVRTIAGLRRSGVSLRRIRAAVDRLQVSGTARTWAAGAGRFAVYGTELYIQHRHGEWEGDKRPGQLVLDYVVPLHPVDGTVLNDHLNTPFGKTAAPDAAGARRRERRYPPTDAPTAARSGPASSAQAAIRRFLEREDALARLARPPADEPEAMQP
jgi:hypothetical protein